MELLLKLLLLLSADPPALGFISPQLLLRLLGVDAGVLFKDEEVDPGGLRRVGRLAPDEPSWPLLDENWFALDGETSVLPQGVPWSDGT